MNNFLYVLLVFLILFTSCETSGGVKKPDDLIDEATMEAILYEATLMEIMNTFSPKNPDFVDILGAPLLYLKHGIDSLQLVESEAYYTKNPRIYYRIYSKVLNRLQREKDSIDRVIKEEKRNQ
jgi:hypothetical protein